MILIFLVFLLFFKVINTFVVCTKNKIMLFGIKKGTISRNKQSQLKCQKLIRPSESQPQLGASLLVSPHSEVHSLCLVFEEVLQQVYSYSNV